MSETIEPGEDFVADAARRVALNGPEHADNRDLVVLEALQIVSAADPGTELILVTHSHQGDPREYLHSRLESAAGRDALVDFLGRRNGGGFLTRVLV
jgi:hypothetical protein